MLEHDDKYNYVFVFYSPKVTVVKSALDDNGLVRWTILSNIKCRPIVNDI